MITAETDGRIVGLVVAIWDGGRLTLYNATQSRIHVIVTNRFLRSLVRLDFAESRVGRYRS